MKRTVSLLMAALLVLTLTACAATKQETLSIQPSDFSKETLEVLKLWKDEVQFFDVSLDETVKSFSMSLWVYRDGQWHEDGQILGGREFLEDRIAIQLTDSSCSFYRTTEGGYTENTYPKFETAFDQSTGTIWTKISEKTPLVLNQETLLWVKVGTKDGQLNTIDMAEDFRNYDCNAGVAITLTVSDALPS